MFLSHVPVSTTAVCLSVSVCVCVSVCKCERGNPVEMRMDDLGCFNSTGGDAGH